MDVKKRRRMKAIHETMQKLAKEDTQEKGRQINLMDCDIGASPKFNPVPRKKGFYSPLAQSRDLDLKTKKWIVYIIKF